MELDPNAEQLEGYSRGTGRIQTEPDVWVRFWILKPDGPGPFPLAVTPHGHENGDEYAGVWDAVQTREKIARTDQDVAVQAAKRGLLAIAPATRGMGRNPSSYRIRDIADRVGRDCRCHAWQVALAGRTMIGERVWDLMRLIDWALALPEVADGRVLMLGNSGGGMATLHAAACDGRIGVAVPCCAFDNYISPHGTMRPCPCNVVPGMLTFGEYWDVAGLIAPRSLLTVNGLKDELHPVAEVDHAVSRLRAIYGTAGCGDRYEHRYGPEGHRFYSSIMWPWIENATRADRPSA